MSASASRTSLYDEITANIIAEFEADRVPWVYAWGTAAAKAPLAIPKNAAINRPDRNDRQRFEKKPSHMRSSSGGLFSNPARTSGKDRQQYRQPRQLGSSAGVSNRPPINNLRKSELLLNNTLRIIN
jgi:hypothetical protein